MFKRVVGAIAIALLLVFGAQAPSHAYTHREIMTCTNPSNGYKTTADIFYTLDHVSGNDWNVLIEAMVFNTDPNFNMDRFWLDIEVSPGDYWAVVHYGGSGNPQNTVSTDWTVFDRAMPINDDSQSPAWRMYAKGVGPGNSTYSCGFVYGSVF
jgi:hypothetical protein